jgi:hypothetical protein
LLWYTQYYISDLGDACCDVNLFCFVLLIQLIDAGDADYAVNEDPNMEDSKMLLLMTYSATVFVGSDITLWVEDKTSPD